MKIAVVHSTVPFHRGGAEVHAEGVYESLVKDGHDVTYYTLPFAWNPVDKILESLMAVRSMCFDRYDKVFAFKFPGYCIEHRDKTIWLFHQFRQAYDLWGTPYQGISNDAHGQAIRRAIFAADQHYLGTANKIFTNSPVTAKRLLDFNGIKGTPLYHPVPDTSIFRTRAYGNYLFYPSRIGAGKRQYLMVEAMQYVQSPVKLIIAGTPDSAGDLQQLENIISRHKVGNKVQLIPHFITEQEKVDFLANALAVPYIPYDEDSYGYVTLEAYYSRRPVITCTDSGGTHITVKDGSTGLIVNPDAKSLAAAIDQLYNSKGLAEKYGNAGFELLQEMGLNWQTVVRKLLE